ncbi:hypothetical protein MJM99_35260, partial [Salmonella enterica subsp. enterica serovar Kentucky]|nr:hypothetical protein [Salmonella enterica subsp. enterica serovar Kentucky]
MIDAVMSLLNGVPEAIQEADELLGKYEFTRFCDLCGESILEMRKKRYSWSEMLAPPEILSFACYACTTG